MDSAQAWYVWHELRRAQLERMPPHQVLDAIFDHCLARGWTCDDFDRWLDAPSKGFPETPGAAVRDGRGADVWAALALVDAPDPPHA